MVPASWTVLVLLASVIEGEAGIVPDAMPLIGHSIMNRVADDSGLWPDNVMGVIEQSGQYNGRAKPSSRAIAVARDVLRREYDPTGGVVHVLSGNDMRYLGCGVGDVIYVSPVASVHGYHDWCGG